MEVQTITVHVRYSKPMTDGAVKTVELGAEASLSPDEDYHEAQVALYHELGETMKYVFSSNGAGNPTSTGSGQAQNSPEKLVETPTRKGASKTHSRPDRPQHWCEEHACDYVRYEKNGKVWWSHKVGKSGNTCLCQKGALAYRNTRTDHTLVYHNEIKRKDKVMTTTECRES
jgi:hypothetical protein